MKQLFFELSDGIDTSGIIMDLSGCMAWIEGDNDNYKESTPEELRPEYRLTPVWLTTEEFNNLPESD